LKPTPHHPSSPFPLPLKKSYPLRSDDLSNDPSRGITRFSPHLSLGQFQSEGAIQECIRVGCGRVTAAVACCMRACHTTATLCCT